MAQRFLSDINLGDNIYLRFGNREDGSANVVGDFTIRHSGANTWLTNSTGTIILKNNADDKGIAFMADNGNGSATTYFELEADQSTYDAGSSAIEALYTTWVDNSRIALGTSRDLLLYHDGANSYINEVGTGFLTIQSDAQIRLGSITGTEKYARFYKDGKVELFYDNSIKFETTSAGIKLPSYGAGYLKTDANGVVTVDSSTIEDTLDSVTDRGATTTNSISVGGITSTGDVTMGNTATDTHTANGSLKILGNAADTPSVLNVINGTDNNEANNATDFRFVAANRVITTERANMELYTNDAQDADLGASIGFGGRHTDSNNNDSLFATIKAGKSNATSGNYQGYLEIGTSDSLSDITRRFKIDSTGAEFTNGVSASSFTTTGNITFDSNLISEDGVINLSTTSNGHIYLRPAGGQTNTDGQFKINSSHFEFNHYGNIRANANDWILAGSGHTLYSAKLNIEARRDGVANLLNLRARDLSNPDDALPNDQGGIVRWQGFDGTDYAQMGAIAVIADGQAVADGDAPSKMILYTVPDGTETLTPALTLDKSQNATIAGNISTSTGNISTATGKRISIGTWDNSAFTGSAAQGFYAEGTTPLLVLEESDQSKTGYVGVSGGNMYVGGVIANFYIQTADGSNRLTINSGAATFNSIPIRTSEDIGRDAHNRIMFSTDDSIIFRVADSHRFRMDSDNFKPYTDSSYDLGTNTVRWRNVYADTYYGDGSNLTGVSVEWDGSLTGNASITGKLSVGGTHTATHHVHIKNTSGDNRGIMIEQAATNSYAELAFKSDLREFRLGTGGDGTNNVNAENLFYIYDATTGGTAGHRFEIDSAGDVKIRNGALKISGDNANYATLTESSAGILTIATVDDFRVDAGGDITLDAAGNDVRFKDSTITYGYATNESDNFVLGAGVQDKDIVFRGNDAGTTVDALVLDMSDEGTATFEKALQVASGSGTGFVSIGTGYATTSALTIHSVSTSAQASAINIIQNGGNGNPIIRMGEKSTNGGRLHMFDGNVEKIAFYTDGTANHISAGNTGFGTNTPDGVIDVHGASGRWRVNTYGGMYFRNDSDTGNEQYIHARSDGRLSIGRSATSNWSGSGNATFFATTYDHLTFATNSDATFAGKGIFNDSARVANNKYFEGTHSNGSTALRMIGIDNNGDMWMGGIDGNVGSVTIRDGSANNTIALASNTATFAGAIVGGSTITAASTIHRGNLTIDSQEIDIGSGDFLLDVAGDITLDAAGNDIRFKKNNVEYGKFKSDSSDFAIYSSVENKDIIFRGNDGGTTIDALTLDMGNGGSAVFRDDIDLGGNINMTGSSKNIVLLYGNEIRTKDSGGTERTVLRASSNKLQYGWSYNGDVEFMGGGSYSPRITIRTDGTVLQTATTIDGALTINPDADSNAAIKNAGTNAIALFAGSGDTLYLGGNDATCVYMDTSANAHFVGDVTLDNLKSLDFADRYQIQTFELPYFTHNTANLAADIYLPNEYVNGILELRIQSGYSYQNAAGEAYFKWIIGLNVNGGVWYTPSLIERHITANHSSQIYVDDPVWDSSVSKYRIRVYHKSDQGNVYEGTLTLTSQGGGTIDGEISISSLLTSTSTTNTHPVGKYYRDPVRIKTGKDYHAANTVADELVIGDGTGHHGMTLYTGTTHQGSIYFADDLDTEAAGDNPVGNRDGVLRYDQSSQHFQLRTAGNQQALTVRHNSSWFEGSLGIGASPTHKLLVSGSNTVGKFHSSSSYVDLLFTNSGGTGGFLNFINNTSFNVYVGGGSGSDHKLSLTNAGLLTVTGDVVAFGSPSDISLKENIKPIDNALDKVSKLKGVTFDWKKSDSILDIKEDIGFIAQDVQEVLPDLVRTNKDGKLSLRDKGIIPVLVEAIKELKAEIEELKCKCDGCTK